MSLLKLLLLLIIISSCQHRDSANNNSSMKSEPNDFFDFCSNQNETPFFVKSVQPKLLDPSVKRIISFKSLNDSRIDIVFVKLYFKLCISDNNLVNVVEIMQDKVCSRATIVFATR